MIRSGVACAFNDLECIERAEQSGDDVYLTDDEGKPVLDDEGMPVSDPDEAADILGKERPGAGGSLPGADAPLPGAGPLPGVGATTNLDFVRGEETVVFTDYSEDNLGDFPRRFELISGSFDVIEWEGDQGSVRIAASKVDLYDRLTRDGRVTTRGILFDVDSDVIQPESAPTLEEIGTTLQEHPDLRISIEGHTDSDGDEASNLDLSERRAEAVRARLIQEYGIDASRLESAGYGESRPVAPNDTPEGKQQNRRVELVRIG